MSHWVRKLFPISEMLRYAHETKKGERTEEEQHIITARNSWNLTINNWRNL